MGCYPLSPRTCIALAQLRKCQESTLRRYREGSAGKQDEKVGLVRIRSCSFVSIAINVCAKPTYSYYGAMEGQVDGSGEAL